jgi:hypothetical protein
MLHLFLITLTPAELPTYLFFSLLSLFWKNLVGLWDDVAVCVCACVCVCLCILPILIGNGLVKIPLALLGNGSEKSPYRC